MANSNIMDNVSTAKVALGSGGAIPKVGLGVWQMPRGVARKAVLEALHSGYRHVDTARIYNNEKDVGTAVRESGIPREEIFITTKLWNDDQGYDSALRAFDASLERLGLDYVDLYLIHWPVPKKRRESWRALEAIKKSGRARAIGVSNFLVSHLEELLPEAHEPPSVNQIEIHPFLQHRDTRAFCKKHGIVVEAYSPLVRGHRLDDTILRKVAKQVERTPAQVLLRWGLQHDLVVLPKSADPGRQKENAAIFDFSLDPKAMAALDALEDGQATGWDPRTQD
ncbi:MAG TPA: aldo/keto reductase [Polyangiaceae bacterium]|nr:aldo/keto reductase [Polyangiaceae bacterium]